MITSRREISERGLRNWLSFFGTLFLLLFLRLFPGCQWCVLACWIPILIAASRFLSKRRYQATILAYEGNGVIGIERCVYPFLLKRRVAIADYNALVDRCSELDVSADELIRQELVGCEVQVLHKKVPFDRRKGAGTNCLPEVNVYCEEVSVVEFLLG
jgi:hypothetical protein